MFPGFNLSTDPNIYIDTESESRSVSINLFFDTNKYNVDIYRMSQDEWTKLRESVPCVEL